MDGMNVYRANTTMSGMENSSPRELAILPRLGSRTQAGRASSAKASRRRRPGAPQGAATTFAGASARTIVRPVRDPEDTIPPRVSETLPPPPDSVPPPSAPFPPDALPTTRGRKIIAIGGGRGGVGKTLLTVNLGVFFAQLGRSVIVCDADPFSSNLHALLGLDKPPLALAEALDEGKLEPVATTVPGLRIMPIAFDPMTATPMRPSRRVHWMAQIQQTQADYVLLNLGSSTTPATLDLFQRADVGVCVTAPEPPAIETTLPLRARPLRAQRCAGR